MPPKRTEMFLFLDPKHTETFLLCTQNIKMHLLHVPKTYGDVSFMHPKHN